MPVPKTPSASTANSGTRTEPPLVFAGTDHGAARDKWRRSVSHQIIRATNIWEAEVSICAAGSMSPPKSARPRKRLV
jgi:hypothetical protein